MAGNLRIVERFDGSARTARPPSPLRIRTAPPILNSLTYWIFLLEAALRGFAEVEDLRHAMQHMDERFQEPPTRGSRCGAPSAGLDTRWACVWRQDLRDRVWSLAREHQVEIFDAGLRQTEGESSGSGGDIVLSADRIRDHFVL